jgi:hypothetical protein
LIDEKVSVLNSFVGVLLWHKNQHTTHNKGRLMVLGRPTAAKRKRG